MLRQSLALRPYSESHHLYLSISSSETDAHVTVALPLCGEGPRFAHAKNSHPPQRNHLTSQLPASGLHIKLWPICIYGYI